MKHVMMDIQVPMSSPTHTVEWKTVLWSGRFHKATFWICGYFIFWAKNCSFSSVAWSWPFSIHKYLLKLRILFIHSVGLRGWGLHIHITQIQWMWIYICALSRTQTCSPSLWGVKTVCALNCSHCDGQNFICATSVPLTPVYWLSVIWLFMYTS